VLADKEAAAKRVKLESGGAGRSSANGTPSRGSRSGSRSEDRQPSEPPRSRQPRLEATMATTEPPYSPSATPASPEESIHSPIVDTLDRHSAERSPTFSTSPGDVPPVPHMRTSNWMEDQRLDHHGPQRHLPSLSDVFDSQRLAGPRQGSNELDGFGFPRDHPVHSPGSIPSLIGSDGRPPMLRKDESSAGSASSGSSYGYPRTPIEGSLPIHALLTSKSTTHFDPNQQQSYFQGVHIPAEQHKPSFAHHVPNGVASPGANGSPFTRTSNFDHGLTIVARVSQRGWHAPPFHDDPAQPPWIRYTARPGQDPPTAKAGSQPGWHERLAQGGRDC